MGIGSPASILGGEFVDGRARTLARPIDCEETQDNEPDAVEMAIEVTQEFTSYHGSSVGTDGEKDTFILRQGTLGLTP